MRKPYSLAFAAAIVASAALVTSVSAASPIDTEPSAMR